ncbi:MAG TPA: SUMF1/EgtB/PvdO family nonheme iron enzyme [Spirochaetota bacterium]|nr:SUMF1/EgtB/PvdO family nonheme iron enzyme [Spirochaetota bacterium]
MPGTFLFKNYLIFFFSFIVMLFIVGCTSDGGSGGGTPYMPKARESQIHTAGSVSFDMIYAPGGTFPTGEDDLGGDETADAFWIAETETTNGLMAAVYQWAYDSGRMSGCTVSATTVTLHGREFLDLDGSCLIGFSSGVFSADTGYEEYPCVEITWFGAVLSCNWLTEMVNGGAGEVVYSGMDSSWDPDETVEDLSKKGFRLLSAVEWECAARYQDGNVWTPGDCASGDTTGPCYPSSALDLSAV